nr:hypothetical protein [uncultured Draconibacterium sp.]
MKVLTTIFIIVTALKITAQTNQTVNYSDLDSIHKARVDSMILSQIPYSKEKAYQDIQNQKIQIIQLIFGGDPGFSNEEINLIEKRFGFHYVYDYLQYPRPFLEKVQNEYNNIVYQYLDSINNIDCKNEIRSEYKRIFYEKVVSSKTDRELKRTIQKKLRGESKQVKTEILNADKLYRDRKFNDALNEYESVSLTKTINETKNYIANSMYHCYMNLQQYAKADSMKNINNEINKIIK